MKWLFPILNLLWKRKIRKNHCKITAEELAKDQDNLLPLLKALLLG
jgi:hypothetical protein